MASRRKSPSSGTVPPVSGLHDYQGPIDTWDKLTAILRTLTGGSRRGDIALPPEGPRDPSLPVPVSPREAMQKAAEGLKLLRERGLLKSGQQK